MELYMSYTIHVHWEGLVLEASQLALHEACSVLKIILGQRISQHYFIIRVMYNQVLHYNQYFLVS